MADTIGRGVIELSADSSKLNAAINEARKSIKGLGDAAGTASKGQSASIDRYVKSLQTQAAVQGRSTRETELYKLALRGASDEQLKAANSALRLSEAYQKGQVIGERIRTTFLAIGAAAATGLIAAAVAFDSLVSKAGNFQDLAEKTGDTAENIASLAVAAGTAGASMDSISAFAIKLTKNLTGVDDESSKAGAAIKALGLDINALKSQTAADQLESIAKALGKFNDKGGGKTSVLEAIAKGGAELLPFLKELGAEGSRQVILTQQQIALADEYSDGQAKLRAEIGLQAQSIATQLIPAALELTSVLRDIAKDQDFASTASEALQTALSAGITVFQTIAIVAANVGFVFKAVGREIGAIAAQMVALANLDIKGFTAISDAVKEDGVRARAELDKFEAKLLSIGQKSAAFADPRILGNPGTIAEQTAANNKRPTLVFNGAAKPGGADKAAREAEQIRRAELDSDIKFLRDKLGEERDTISFHQRELSALYAAGNLSLRQFYDERNKSTAEGVQRELNLLTDEQARLEVELSRVKDPSDRIKLQTQLDESVSRSGKVAVAAARDARLANLEEAQSFKQLQDSVADYRSNLLQLQGDEAGAARLRAAQTIEQARALSRQSNGQISAAEVEALQRSIESSIKVNEAKTRTGQINQELAIQEERIALLQKNGSIGEIEALQRTGAARQKVFGELAKQVEELQAQADKNPLNVQLQIDADQARLELEKLGEQLDPLAEKFNNLFRDAATNTFGQLLSGEFFKVDQGKLDKSLSDIERQFDASAERLKGVGSDNDQLKAFARNERERKAAIERARKDATPSFGDGALKAAQSFGEQIAKSFTQDAAKQLSDIVFGKGGIFGDAGGILSDLFGGKKDPLAIKTATIEASLSNLAASGIDPTIAAFGRLQDRLNGAGVGGGELPSGEQSIADLFKETDESQKTAARSASDLSFTLDQTITACTSFGDGLSRGNSALSQLPAAVRAFQAVISAFSTTSSGSSSGDQAAGWVNLIGSFFGGGSGSYNYTGDTTGTQFSQTGEMIRARRGYGGSVGAGGAYEVNERDGPELLSVAGKDYLMMGSQGGKVTPAATGNGQRPIDVKIYQSFAPGTSGQTTGQAAVQAANVIKRSSRDT